MWPMGSKIQWVCMTGGSIVLNYMFIDDYLLYRTTYNTNYQPPTYSFNCVAAQNTTNKVWVWPLI